MNPNAFLVWLLSFALRGKRGVSTEKHWAIMKIGINRPEASDPINQKTAALFLLMFDTFEVDCSSCVSWKRWSFLGLSTLTVNGQQVTTVRAHGSCVLSRQISLGKNQFQSLCSSGAHSPTVGTVPGHLHCNAGPLSLPAWGLKAGVELLLVPPAASAWLFPDF